jgi:hypothetical protein
MICYSARGALSQLPVTRTPMPLGMALPRMIGQGNPLVNGHLGGDDPTRVRQDT